MSDPEKNLRQEVLKAIETGQVKMRPKWQFVLRSVLLLLAIALVALAALYIASFIVFVCRQNGVCLLPEFGWSSLRAFLSSLPWILVGLALVFAALLEVLIRRYEFAYGRPFLYSAFGVLALVAAIGVAVGLSPLHEQLEHAHIDDPFYRQFGQSPRIVTLGTVVGFESDGFSLRCPDGDIYDVDVSHAAQLPAQALTLGQPVVVFGRRAVDDINAEGVRTLSQLPPPLPSGE